MGFCTSFTCWCFVLLKIVHGWAYFAGRLPYYGGNLFVSHCRGTASKYANKNILNQYNSDQEPQPKSASSHKKSIDASLLKELKDAASQRDKILFNEKLHACFKQAKEGGEMDFFTYTEMINSAIRFGEGNMIHSIVESCEELGLSPNSVILGKTIHNAAKARRWLLAANLMSWMRTKGLDPGIITYAQVVAEMAKNKQYYLITDLLRTEGIEPTKEIFNALISGCSKAGDINKAFTFFNEMKDRNVARDAVTYGSMLGAVKQSRNMDQAFDLFRQMQLEGIKPDQYCYNTLMAVCSKAGDHERALDIFTIMGEDNVQKDVVSYNTAIAACEKIGDDKQAIQIMKTMLESNVVPDAITFHSTISACGRAGNWKDALKLFTKMDKFAVKKGTISYNAVISALVRSGEWQTALSLFEEMKLRRVARDKITYGSALHAVMVGNDHLRAIQLLEEMEGDGIKPNIITFGTALHTCVNAGKIDAALTLYEKAAVYNVRPNQIIYKLLIVGCAAAGKEDKVISLLKDMDDTENDGESSLDTHILNSAIAAADKYPFLMREIVKFARLSINISPNLMNYNSALKFLGEQIQIIDDSVTIIALELYSWMKEDGISPNGATFNALNVTLQRTGDWDKLQQILKEARLSNIDFDTSNEFDIEAVTLTIQERLGFPV
mmetsp:Transcript_7951/g.10490  ORF Transcript_7951/g.10490 Transcript_7951/m.10490 type:complete len:666 (+) Transcript_7951:97-2094(+)